MIKFLLIHLRKRKELIKIEREITDYRRNRPQSKWTNRFWTSKSSKEMNLSLFACLISSVAIKSEEIEQLFSAGV
jgi:hypothetical protein